ncbi:MAG TPA: hypothetical protein VFF81_11485 [Noviherbaspirillum sp.]|nr:hypothetical protein [Noviherbaspirillum sp.]
MGFDDWKRERAIKKTLRALSRQRVALIGQPGNVLVIERGLPDADSIDEHLHTCLLRGWIEVLHEAIPQGRLSFNHDNAPTTQGFTHAKPIYRLTEGGWAVLNRSHAWVLATFVVSVASLMASVLAMWK